jgi:hypothetical protein
LLEADDRLTPFCGFLPPLMLAWKHKALQAARQRHEPGCAGSGKTAAAAEVKHLKAFWYASFY